MPVHIANCKGTGCVTITIDNPGNVSTITFGKNNPEATGTMAPQSDAGGTAAVLSPNTFTRAGWTFAGWAMAPEGKVTCNDGAEFTMGDKNVTLYAIWITNAYTVTFDKNDPAGAGTLNKNGYAFNGWNTKIDGSGTAYQQDALLEMGDAEVTLYTQWKVQTCTMTVTTDGNVIVNSAIVTVEYGKDCSPITATP